ncbi:hypothetical protein [Rubripirellula amarantea]|nr:hypothetical protein [Rubripirellula amarantea]
MNLPRAVSASLLLLSVPLIPIGWLFADQPESVTVNNVSKYAGNEVDHVARLIDQLGAPSYATRIRARDELQRMGLEAFEQLREAQFHPDIEVEMAARYLVSSLLVSWSKDSDPADVRETLNEYGAQDEVERSKRIDRLAELDSRIGLAALVRLTRFETSLRLSEIAALAAMNQASSADEAVRRQHSQQILNGLGDSQRASAQWLRLYAQDLVNDGFSKLAWQQLIQQQRQQIDAGTTKPSTQTSVLELVQICAARAAKNGQIDEALELAKEHIDLIQPTTRHLIDASSWAIDHGLHPFVLELRSNFGRMFDTQPVLLYGAAEAHQKSGHAEQANEIASLALKSNPFPDDEDKKDASPREMEETAYKHRDVAMTLRRRGLFPWAENEYQLIIRSMEVDSLPSIVARADLARMQGELHQHQDVVDTLTPLVNRLEKDAKLKQRLGTHLFATLESIRSDLEYHTAQVLLAQKDLDEARERLRLAYRLSPLNIDILIEMYRTEGDDQWDAEVKRSLDREIKAADRKVAEQRRNLRTEGFQGKLKLGDYLNNYAWLVANTEGDMGKALAYSLESLTLDPDAAKYDTCARCYFANGDLANAIAMQKKAIKEEPHSPPLLRQLREFEEALGNQSEN